MKLETIRLIERFNALIRNRKKRYYRAQDHPFFGCMRHDTRSVEEIMRELIKPRYDEAYFETFSK